MTRGFVGSVGLLLDVAGAFFLAESFVIKKRTDIAREARSYFDGNLHMLRSAAHQAVEARVGFVFLALGFLAQFLAYTKFSDVTQQQTRARAHVLLPRSCVY